MKNVIHSLMQSTNHRVDFKIGDEEVAIIVDPFTGKIRVHHHNPLKVGYLNMNETGIACDVSHFEYPED